ncbi:MAG: cardiolipin synthase [Flavobacteriales bacterium]
MRRVKKKRIKRSGTVSLLILLGALFLYLLLQLNAVLSSYSSKEFWDIVDLGLSSVFSITILAAVVIVILENKEPVKATAWILVLVLLPVVGIICYIFFGRNFRKERLFSRKELHDQERLDQLTHQQQSSLPLESSIQDRSMSSKLRTMILLLNNNKALLTQKNRTRLLTAGETAFERIFDAIRNARHHIHLESYIINEDSTGKALRDLLIHKAREGVETRVIYDDVGSWSLSRDFLHTLQKAGVRIRPFLPVRFPLLASQLNYRNHRKVLVIDGGLAFSGGMNIADKYRFEDPVLGPWQDVHLELEGEAVKSLQAVFSIDWFFVEGERLEGSPYFNPPRVDEDKWVQVVTSGPDSEYASIMEAYFSAIVNAREKILIANPYFIPNESIFTALKTAAMSGVEVHLIIPGVTDSWITKAAGNSFIGELLDAGVHVHEYWNGFIHSKVMTVDDAFVSIGSANLDHRSFNQNFEVNTLIYDHEQAIEVRQMLESDLENSHEIDPVRFSERPFSKKFQESVIRLFSPLL